VLALCTVFAGCNSKMLQAKSAFHAGNYGEARLALTELEPAIVNWSVQDRTVFALYRGMTCQAQGDLDCAHLWLYRAKSAVDAAPASLDETDRARLRLALESLGDGPRAPL
jgi:hypothetical protein